MSLAGRPRTGSNRGLPRFVRIKKGRYYLQLDGQGGFIEAGRPLSFPLGGDRSAAIVKAESILKELNVAVEYRGQWTDSTYGTKRGTIGKQVLRLMLYRCKSSARARGIACTLTMDDMSVLAARSKGRCEITGIPFEYDRSKHAMRPWAPSIDRLECAGGYAVGNCRVICFAVNAALNQWGITVLARIAHALSKRMPLLRTATGGAAGIR